MFKSKYMVPALLLLAVAAFQFITMPAFFYPGDNFAVRIEAAHWLETGHLEMPFKMKKQMPGFFDQRGQYFYENDEAQTFSSKYGIGNTLAYLVPTLAERLYNESAAPMSSSRSMLLFINVWQIAITLGITLYLYLLAGLYTPRRALRAALILLMFYTTYVWHYLRAPTLEIFQMLPFIASYFHMTVYLRSRKETETPRWGHLAAAISFSCLLVWMKAFFIVNCAVIAVLAVLTTEQGKNWLSSSVAYVKAHPKQLALALLLPAILLASVVLATNTYKFGGPLETGYGQWVDGGAKDASFSLASLKKSIPGFFWGKGNSNAFIHYPLLTLSLLGLPLFWKRHRSERGLLLTIIVIDLLLVGTFRKWSGAWCYGPRYLIHLMILLTLPLIPLTEWLIEKKTLRVRLAILAVIAPLLGWSLFMQINTNSLHYFASYRIRSTFKNLKRPEIDAYFQPQFHFGQLHGDLIKHRRKKETFPPLEKLSEMVAPQHRNVIKQLDTFLLNQAKWNYYFAKENQE